MKKRVLSIAAVGGLALLAGLLSMPSRGVAQTPAVTSDRGAGLVIFPKIRVDTGDIFAQGRSLDTIIQLTNTSQSAPRVVECFYVDATSHCSNGINTFDPTGICRTNADCNLGGTCDPGWIETDFTLTLTPNQPVGWTASAGFLNQGICSGGPRSGLGCDPVDPDPPAPPVSNCAPGRCLAFPIGRINPLAPYFIGELKCVEVDSAVAQTPINANDLIGNATIEEVRSGPGGSVDARSYNAIGIQAVVADGTAQSDPPPGIDHVLCLGANGTTCPTPEYASCPSTLILDHFFDRFSPGARTVTDLTLVPCSERLANGVPQTSTAVQFLVFNEFEQRFSASTRIDCFSETALSSIDTRLGQEAASIFNVAVQGTLTGQTRIRPVMGSETDTGHGLLAIAEEFTTQAVGPSLRTGSAAFNLNYSGSNPGKADLIRFTPQGP